VTQIAHPLSVADAFSDAQVRGASGMTGRSVLACGNTGVIEELG
jgi:hypothetical protein